MSWLGSSLKKLLGLGNDDASVEAEVSPRPSATEIELPLACEGNVLEESVGLEVAAGRFEPVLESGASVPVAQTIQLATSFDSQRDMSLHLQVRLADSPSTTETLARLRVHDLPARPPGEVVVALAFRAEPFADGGYRTAPAETRLFVTATLEEKGERLPIELATGRVAAPGREKK